MATASKKHQLTREGLTQLVEELRVLKEETRAEIAERLKEAISFGDLSENAEYEAAREHQAQVEHRIMELEDIVKNHEIIDETKGKNRKTVVSIGSQVTLVVKSEGKTLDEETFKIVGSTEASVFSKQISNESPIGTAIMGREAGATVSAKAPAGMVEITIVSIS
ncbi:MAG TPA: transcription elongation factor GreA [bacterium]|nr:transcription elongation factor GreA [bacterium]